MSSKSLYEIERKFLVNCDEWKSYVDTSIPITQHYLVIDEGKTVRVRQYGEQYILTIKISTNSLMSCVEIEKDLTKQEYDELAKHSLASISKIRYNLGWLYNGWEVDVFANNLVIAEIELDSEDQHIDIPAWTSHEVTHDKKYKNVNMAREA